MTPTLLEKNAPDPDPVDEAITALTAAARGQRIIGAGTANEHAVPADFAGTLSRILASVAANVGGIEALLQGRPEQSNFTLDFSQVDRDLWNATSEASRPKPERPYLDPLPLVNVFALATKERGEQQTKETGTVHLDLSKASYSAARESLNKAPLGQDTKARRGTPYLPGQSLGTHGR